MIPYALLMLVPMFAAVRETSRPIEFGRRPLNVAWLIALLVTGIMIGLRYEVGGDWDTYLNYVTAASLLTFNQVVTSIDPGYILLNWIATKFGWGIAFVNLVCGFLFAYGLVRFCLNLPRPWLGFVTAVPYLIIVVGMGYSRQAVALGLALISLNAFQRHRTIQALVWLLLAVTFHRSAIFLLLLIGYVSTTNKILSALAMVALVATSFALLIEGSSDQLYDSYFLTEYQSEGAMIRLAMNLVAAGLLLMFRHRFAMLPADQRVWKFMAFAAVLMFAAFFVTPASTALDRLALYIIPLQVFVFANLPQALAPHDRDLQFRYTLMILAYQAAIMAVWFGFATHAEYWLPYRFYPFRDVG